MQLRSGRASRLSWARPDRAFTGDKLWVAGLRVVEGYHGNELGAYQRMLSLTIDSVPVTDSPTFWRHENVQYVYTAADEATMTQVAAQLKAPPFVKLAGPVRNAAGSMVYASRVGVDNPPAWVATGWSRRRRTQALATVLDPRFDPRTVAIADSSFRDIAGQQIQSVPPPAAVRATVTSYAPGAIDVKLDQPATAGQALVVSENYFPGWHATVDGKPAATVRTDELQPHRRPPCGWRDDRRAPLYRRGLHQGQARDPRDSRDRPGMARRRATARPTRHLAAGVASVSLADFATLDS